MVPGRSVQTAALAAGVAGLVAMIILSWLFVSGDPLLGLARGERNPILGLPLAFLLLVTVGGYGLLAFYGFRLRTLWAQRRLTPSTPRRHDPGRLALSDLRKIRLLSSATMIAILLVYLLPVEPPSMLGDSDGDWSWDGPRAAWWQSPNAMKVIVLGWTMTAAMVVLLSRRAAWDIAAAAGNISGPDDVRAFQVVRRTSLRTASPPTSAGAGPDVAAGAPMAAIPLTAEESAGVTTPIGTVPSGESVLSTIDRAAIAETLNSRRDWEAVVLGLLILLLLLCVGMTDTTRSIRRYFLHPGLIGDVYDLAFAGVAPAAPWGRPPGPSNPSALRGTLGAMCVASEMFIAMMAAIGILWAALCLMWGPLFRRTAVFLMSVTIAAILFSAAATPYFEVYFQGRNSGSRTTWGRSNLPSIDVDLFESRIQLLLLPAALLFVLTRPPIRALFDMRIRKAKMTAT